MMGVIGGGHLEMAIPEGQLHGIENSAGVFHHLGEGLIELVPHVVSHRVGDDGNHVQVGGNRCDVMLPLRGMHVSPGIKLLLGCDVFHRLLRFPSKPR